MRDTLSRVIERPLQIEMRDGVVLAADLYLPANAGEALPLLLERTPYDKSGPSRTEKTLANASSLTRPDVARWFARRGYAVVMQDCRGRFESEGVFRKYLDEAKDGYDTLAWLIDQDFCNGKIGTFGLSYGAHTQFALAALGPPGLATMFVDSGGFSSAFDYGIRQGGAFELKQVTWALRHALQSPKTAANPARKAALEAVDLEDWLRRIEWQPGASPLSAAPEYEEYFFAQWRNGVFSEQWARPGLYARGHYEEFPDVPIAIVGSWYDPYAVSCISNFRALAAMKSSPIHLLMGPWTHGDRSQSWSGDVDFGKQATLDDNIAANYFDLRLQWFNEHLMGDKSAASAFADPVCYFRMGGGSGARNRSGHLQHGGEWCVARDWPPENSTQAPMYLHASGELLPTATTSDSAFCEFLFDPRNPVPTIGGAVTSGEPIMFGGAFDQVQTRTAFSVVPVDEAMPLCDRPDVVSFLSESLTNSVEVSGAVSAELWVSSDQADTDFTIKLIDVYPPSEDYPDGYAMLITDGIFRTRYKDGFDRESTLEPDGIYAVTVRALDTSNVFASGHKIRLDISSSNYPRFDINPNTGNAPGDMRGMRVARNRVHCGEQTPSRLLLTIRD